MAVKRWNLSISIFFLFLVRYLPDLLYLGTIRDSETSTGSITTFCLQEIEKKLHFVSGGEQLRVWSQVAKRGQKRKGYVIPEVYISKAKYCL